MPTGRFCLPQFCVRRISVVLAVAWSALTALAAPVDFAREIQPLLADKCYDCHGPEKAKGGLRLTARPEALRGGESGEPAIVVGHGAKSPLIQRLTTAEPDDVMPQKGARLSDAEVKLLQRWIDEGAVWPENVRHWAYVAPVRPAVPSVGAAWPAAVNAIDAFVFNRLQREGLRPSPAADKSRWLRRVSLDLTGLPPTPVERAAFLADDSPGSDERVVDRLLASPAYGERWARPWLDLARYADSHGFQRDDLRDLWPYRDWVIRALNADMPFDQFTTWQLAGDLVPEAKAGRTLEPLVATGFHRAAPTNVEAGTDQEEGRVNQVFDRVNTTGAVWLGTTLECAQCHNHKYDPFSQKDYYRLFAYFNQAEQETEFASAKAMATLKFTGPYLTLPDPTQETKRPALETRAAELEARIAARTKELATRQEGWEKVAAKAVVAPAQEHVLTVTAFESVGEASYRILPDQSVLIVDDVPETDTYYLTVNTSLTDITGFKLEALTDPSLPGTGPGRGDAARPNFVLNNVRVTATPPGGTAQPVIFVQARASFAQAKFPVENLLRTDNEAKGGWAISPQFKRDHWAVLTTERPLGDAGGVTFTFCLEQNFGAARTIGRVRLSALTGGAGGVAVTADVAAILRLEKARRTKAQAAKVQEYFFASDRDLAALKQAKVQVGQALAALAGVRTLVMREVATTRPTAVLKRGNFLDQGEAVSAGVPAALHPAPIAPAGNRLDLARWLVDRSNPLVARVTINRWWAEFFGRGIVPTLEDFGVKGESPTHPELLDWLAVEFMDHGWSVKHVHRLIALSATYRQSSRVTPEMLARDDQNRWLARGPRFRLDAEGIRDNALAVAGLLSLKQGGPPVRPYQPPGLWDSKVGGDRVTYDVSTGEDAHRRGIYTVWKRSSPYPSFVNFDANARTACTVRRSRSNTPLQALTLLNDPVYVEAARAFARRIQLERPAATLVERIRYAFELGLSRSPSAVEAAALERLFAQQQAAHASETIAWEAVAAALLNLDEMITKG
ncbi:MAG: PSD1 and planctomycete cytochrome C domain-containing protein [Verrucomicrobiota bacterium]